MSGEPVNRQWLLGRRPHGAISIDDFIYNEAPAPDPAALRPGEILVRNRLFMCAPTMRNWMAPVPNSLYPTIPIGAPVMAPAGGVVVASARDGITPGMQLFYGGSWQDYQVLGANDGAMEIPADTTLVEAMGPLGLNARTAYYGLLLVGKPQAGETLLVSGAAGSTGSVVAQLGKIVGCRVIGIAGGEEKCRYLVEQCGIDAAIDYRKGDLEGQIRATCPDGVDLFFDNVGGETLNAGIDNMKRHGRIVLCGQIATYNDQPAPPLNMMRLIYGGISMLGFLQNDFQDQAPAAIAQLKEWVRAGKIKHREDVRTGFRQIPETFSALFSGSNEGTLLAAIE